MISTEKTGPSEKGASEELQLKWGMYYQKAGTAWYNKATLFYKFPSPKKRKLFLRN
jgi:hypothetical protein